MLKIEAVSKSYMHNKKELRVIDDINLNIDDHQFVVFLGPSGCGKTTLLKLISGLLPPSQGHVYLDGEEIKKPDQNMGVIFQDASLFPWLTVKQNILFGPKLAKMPEQKQEQILGSYLGLTQLENYAEFYPNSLSGGMQQRVAIARTLANNPSLLLMDEPFASLDPQIREQMQNLVSSIYTNEKKTIIFITHDISEAILLADIVYVMTSKPMKIKNSISIPLQRPRHHLKYTDDFYHLEKMLAKALSDSENL